jgi:hypothetical protein
VTCLERATVPLPDVRKMSCCQPWLTEVTGRGYNTPAAAAAARSTAPSMKRSLAHHAAALPTHPSATLPEQQGLPRMDRGAGGPATQISLGSGAHASEGNMSPSFPLSHDSAALLVAMGSSGAGQGSSGPGSTTQLHPLSEARQSSGSGHPARAGQAVVSRISRELSGKDGWGAATGVA